MLPRTPFKVTWKGNELRQLSKNIPSNVSTEAGFSEIETALKMGIMPHRWFEAPRWSRVIAVAVSNIRSKLDYLSASERGG
jgi:hypothetical protein